MAYFDSPFELERVHQIFFNSEFPPKKFPWLKIRLQPENRYIAFYKSGKVLISGLKSMDEAHSVAERIVSKLHNAGFQSQINKIQLINAVCMTSISMNNTLEKIIENLDPKKASYEPEQFPGLIYKDFGVTFLIFSTGKVIITGIKNLDQLDEIFEQFLSVVLGSILYGIQR